jgi:hypothetical protein
VNWDSKFNQQKKIGSMKELLKIPQKIPGRATFVGKKVLELLHIPSNVPRIAK